MPIYGFGGSVAGQTRHCFALTFNDAAPEVPGVEGMVGAYKNSFQVRWPQQTRGIRVGCAQAREAIARTATTGPVSS